MRANVLLKYGGGGGALSWAADWFIIYCSVPRSRVWGALSSLGQGSTCWTHWSPIAGVGKRAMNEVFLNITGLWGDIISIFRSVMSTLGTSYYAESSVLSEQDEIAPRYPSAAGVEQTMLTEYGGHESCPLQGKSTLFAGSWNPITGHPPNPGVPTYIHHHYTSGDSDGMFARSWALDPVSASLCLTGLPSTAMHYEIKPEPLIGSAECTPLETHTPLLSDIGNDETLAEIPRESTPTDKAPTGDKTAEETRETEACE